MHPMPSVQFSSVQSLSRVRLSVTPWPHYYRVVVYFLSHVGLFGTPWTVAGQAPLSMGFSRQEYWSGLPFPSPGDPPNPGIKLKSPALAGRFFTTEPPEKSTIPEAGLKHHLLY